MTRFTTCIFDAYGTLFDVSAAARALAAAPGREGFAAVWQQVAADWRAKQLEYSWLRAVTGDYCDFWQVTEDGLDWALERAGLEDDGLRDALLGLYWRLEAYPEVPAMLARLGAAGLTCAILSNGSPRMLAAAVASAGLEPYLDDVLSVEAVGNFKPDARVYDMVGERFGGPPRGGAVRVLERLGRVCGRGLWLRHAVGQSRATARRPLAGQARPHRRRSHGGARYPGSVRWTS